MAFLKLTSISTAIASQPILNDLIPRPGNEGEYSDLAPIKNLPSVTTESAIANIITTILGWSMILGLIALVVTGIFYLTSNGEEENTTKAKKMLMYLLIGMVVIASAYGIVSGVAKINFFEAV